MSKVEIKKTEPKKDIACSAYGMCSKDPAVFRLQQVSIYGLKILSGYNKKNICE